MFFDNSKTKSGSDKSGWGGVSPETREDIRSYTTSIRIREKIKSLVSYQMEKRSQAPRKAIKFLLLLVFVSHQSEHICEINCGRVYYNLPTLNHILDKFLSTLQTAINLHSKISNSRFIFVIRIVSFPNQITSREKTTCSDVCIDRS